ncbi:hypothetical protein B0O99DRAFT_181427 [Bisporella sp. PMI_857]|nr:hypothetical protein B0O99DRAFT_181427 [Bisporella sp. PMI_857]
MGSEESDCDASRAALVARDRGNALYKAGNLTAAEPAYTEAARLAPRDPRPLSNVSAVKFEMGNYIGAAIFAEKALKLLEHNPDPVLKQKICVRLAKSYLHVKQYTQAKAAVSGITTSEERRQIELSAHVMEASDIQHPDAKSLWNTVIERLPQLKAALQNEPEYYSVGHDNAETIFQPQMSKYNQNSYSFLFAGIGDGRNLFATLGYINLMAVSESSLLSKKFHFTLLDIKPAVFARDLLMFRLLLDAAEESSTKSSETLVTLSYLFTAQVMPAWAYSRLQLGINDLLNELQRQDSDIMGRFYVDTRNRALIGHHLQNWQKNPQRWCNTSAFITLTREQVLARRMQTMHDFGPEADDNDKRPPGCEAGSPDVLGYEDLGVMLPHMHLLEKYEGRLLKLLELYGKNRTLANKQKLDQYLIGQWKSNVTVVDFEYEEKRQGGPNPLLDFTPHETASSLFVNIPHRVAGQGVRGVLPHLEGFFFFIKNSLNKIWNQTTFDIVADDMISYFERTRYGLLQDRDRFGSIQPSSFPDRYDHIYMSNIPDYVGGPLATFIHGLPILRNDRTSIMTSNVLRNTRRWVTHNQFLTEYLLLADRVQIASNFSACLTDASILIEQAVDGTLIAGMGAIMSQNMSWMRLSSKPLGWSKLMPRRDLERWLHAHLLKICLPFSRSGDWESRVLAPLNLTTVFWLIVHLFNVGYPAHWLSGVLTNFSTGVITSTARAPRSMVTDAVGTTAIHPSRTISIRPFVTEFRMLLLIWQRLLPFGLLYQETLENQLSDLHDIRQFKIKFGVAKDFYDTANERSVCAFVLVFWNLTVNGEMPLGISLRTALLDDESVKSQSFLQSMLRRAGEDRPEWDFTVHVVSSISWNRETATASFWFPSDVVENMTAGDDNWGAYIWSTDTWETALGPVSVTQDSVISGASWC